MPQPLPIAVWGTAVGLDAALIGLLVLGLYLFRRRQRELSLAAFGATALLYGVRMLIEVRLQQPFDGSPPPALLFAGSLLTYLVVIPLSGFLVLVFGPGRRNSMLWSFRGAVLFAAAGILSDLTRNAPRSLETINNVLVILWAGVVFVNAFLPGLKKTRESAIVLAGFIVFGLFALNANLVSLNLLPWTWSQEEIGFLVFLAALGLVAARRYSGNEARLRSLERELEIARRIQASILPQALPSLPGVWMAARYVPAAAVAGDFYDVLAPDSKHLCALVADVSGHGLGAALLASMLKIAFASQREHFSDPGRVLAGMNRALFGKFEGSFVTAACLSLDLEAGRLRYAAAGHPPMLMFRRDAPKAIPCGQNGLILGPFPEADFPVVSAPIRAGDRFLIYTDGVTEARDRAGAFFEEDGITEFIRDSVSLPAGPFADALLARLTAWTGRVSQQAFDDDVTLLVLDMLEESPRS